MSSKSWRWSCFLVVLFLTFGAYAQAAADLAVTKTGPTLANPGDDVSYDVTVTNNGPSPAVAVTLSDPIPLGMTFVSATQHDGPAFNCPLPNPGTNGTITCTLLAFPASTSAHFTFVFNIDTNVAPGTPFNNTATIGSTTLDPNNANNSSTATTSLPLADLAVTKTGPEVAAAGSNVPYIVTITNYGPEAATDAALSDPIPAGMTFVSATQDTGPLFSCSTPAIGDPGTVDCTIASLAAGASAQFTFVFQIAPDAAPGTQFSNFASASSKTGDPNEENNTGTATTSTPPPPQADLALSKNGPSSAGENTDVTFTIVLTNAGPDAATNVTLDDTLPGTMTFVSLNQNPLLLNCTTPAIGAGGTISCTAATLPAGATTTLSLTGHIPGQTPSGTVFSNTALVSSDIDPNEENNSGTQTVTVSSADVSVAKTGPNTVIAGQNITYGITVANNGPDLVAPNVVLSDQLPAGTTMVSFDQNSGPAAACFEPAPGTNGLISCLFDLGGTPATFTLVVATSPSVSGTINNTAQVTSESFDPDASDNTSTVSTTVTPEADLSIVKNGPGTVTAGQNVTYTLTASNAGPSNAANVTIADLVPANTTFVSATQNTGPTFNCTNAINCTIASFPANSTATFTFVFHVNSSASGTITNTAGINSPATDPNGLNNSSTVNSTVATSADLSVTKSGAAAITAGSNLTYTINVANAGPSDAQNVTLTDTIPANTTYVSVTQTSGPTFSCTPAISCSIASFASGASASFTVVVHVNSNATGSVSNTAQIASTTADPGGSNNSSSVNTVISSSADVSVSKTGPPATTAGSNVTYTVIVANAGPSDANNVSLTDTLPAGTTFVSHNQTGTPFSCTTPAVGAPGTITCTTAVLAPAASTTFTFVFNIAPTTSGLVENTANVATTTTDPNNANNSSTASTAVDAGPTDLAITKTTTVSQVGFGAPVTYTITVTNNGPSTAFGTTVTDILPAGTTYQSATPSQGSCANSAGTVTCNLGTLNPSATATIALTVTMPTTPATVSNTATVTAINAETSPANNASTAALAVTAEVPSLSEYGLALLGIALIAAALWSIRMQ